MWLEGRREGEEELWAGWECRQRKGVERARSASILSLPSNQLSLTPPCSAPLAPLLIQV